jgi:nucleotide-binding universal stress UspA family protein
MFDKVLLPIDINHPESWEKALPMALRVAGKSGQLHVLGIVHDLGAAMVASYLPEGFEQQAVEQLNEGLKAFIAEQIPAGTNAMVHVGHGHVPQTILGVADEIGADLIVMASHPPNDFQTLLIGSNADKVVRHARLPVLVVR